MAKEMDEYKVAALDMKHLPDSRAPFKIQFRQLLRRSILFTRREPQVARQKLFNNVFVAVLIMILYWHVGDPTKLTDYLNMSGLIFAWSVQTLVAWAFGSILTFQTERPVFLRE